MKEAMQFSLRIKQGVCPRPSIAYKRLQNIWFKHCLFFSFLRLCRAFTFTSFNCSYRARNQPVEQ